jgi:hypothetical protein
MKTTIVDFAWQIMMSSKVGTAPYRLGAEQYDKYAPAMVKGWRPFKSEPITLTVTYV